MKLRRKIEVLLAATIVAAALASPSLAGSGFIGSDDAKEKDEPQSFLKNYDKMTKGKEADWAWFAEGVDLKAIKTVSIPVFESNGKGREPKRAAEDGQEYLEKWIDKSDLGWKLAKSGGDITLKGNVFNAWEPGTGARMWGGWMANPGCGLEVVGKDKSGKVLFEIRQKSKGSTPHDAVENALENVVKEIEKHR